MVNIVGSILSVAKSLNSFRNKLSTAKRQQRLDMAEYLDSISNVLKWVHDDLQKNIVPHGACEQLLFHANNMTAVIPEDIISNIDEISEKLKLAHGVEELFSLWEKLNNAEDKTQGLIKIAEAAGLLHALADFVKAGGTK